MNKMDLVFEPQQFDGRLVPPAAAKYVMPKEHTLGAVSGHDYTHDWVSGLSVKKEVAEAMHYLINRHTAIMVLAGAQGVSPGATSGVLCNVLWWMARRNSLVLPLSMRSVALWTGTGHSKALMIREVVMKLISNKCRKRKISHTRRVLTASSRAFEYRVSVKKLDKIDIVDFGCGFLNRQGILAARHPVWFSYNRGSGWSVNHRVAVILLLAGVDSPGKILMNFGIPKSSAYRIVAESRKFISAYDEGCFSKDDECKLVKDSFLDKCHSLGVGRIKVKADRIEDERNSFRSLTFDESGRKIFRPDYGMTGLYVVHNIYKEEKFKRDKKLYFAGLKRKWLLRSEHEMEMWLTIIKGFGVRMKLPDKSQTQFVVMLNHADHSVASCASLAVKIRDLLFENKIFKFSGSVCARLAYDFFVEGICPEDIEFRDLVPRLGIYQDD